MEKDSTYHYSAVRYNEGLAEAAERLAETLEHPEIQKWCRGVGKQHRFHAKRHKAALSKMDSNEEAGPVEQIPGGLDVPDLTPEEIERLDNLTTEYDSEVATEAGVDTDTARDTLSVVDSQAVDAGVRTDESRDMAQDAARVSAGNE